MKKLILMLSLLINSGYVLAASHKKNKMINNTAFPLSVAVYTKGYTDPEYALVSVDYWGPNKASCSLDITNIYHTTRESFNNTQFFSGVRTDSWHSYDNEVDPNTQIKCSEFGNSLTIQITEHLQSCFFHITTVQEIGMNKVKTFSGDCIGDGMSTSNRTFKTLTGNTEIKLILTNN